VTYSDLVSDYAKHHICWSVLAKAQQVYGTRLTLLEDGFDMPDKPCRPQSRSLHKELEVIVLVIQAGNMPRV
jgi:hypothetical protein